MSMQGIPSLDPTLFIVKLGMLEFTYLSCFTYFVGLKHRVWVLFLMKFSITNILVCIELNVPVNNFSVMSGQSQLILGLTSTVGSQCVLFKETTQ